MSEPDQAEGRREPRGRRILQALIQSRAGRTPVLLGIFVLVVLTAGRAAPAAAPGPAAPGTVRAAEFRGFPVGTTSGSSPAEPSPEALAVDNLLARYDALIRLLEARSIDGRGAVPDSALADLRALRGRTYAAARHAVTSTRAGEARR